MQKTANKGFTLIEMLLVIVIIGILMGAVVVGINPLKRINDAKDAGLKTNIGAVGTAVEACYTKNQASFAACDTLAELETDGFIKSAVLILGTVPNDVKLVTDVAGVNACACVQLFNAQTSGLGWSGATGTVTCAPGTTTECKYFTYRSSQGKADIALTNYCTAATCQ